MAMYETLFRRMKEVQAQLPTEEQIRQRIEQAEDQGRRMRPECFPKIKFN